jgi:hypothetical protein
MKKQSFIMRDKSGSPIGEPVDFYPLVFRSGGVVHKLALHLENNNLPKDKQAWVISHPASGFKVCEVTAYCKGVPVSSQGWAYIFAREFAVEALKSLYKRVGPEKFNSVLNGVSK